MAAGKAGSKRARSTKVEGVTPLSAGEFKVIRALHPGFVTMMRQLDADLQREHRMSHAEFVALMFLSEAPDRTLGLSELARRCQQSLSAISRTVGRMEAQGLVRREQSSQDARAYNAVLTDAGLTRLEQAVPATSPACAVTYSITSTVSTSKPSAMPSNASRPPLAETLTQYPVNHRQTPRWGDTSRPERVWRSAGLAPVTANAGRTRPGR